MKYWMGLGILLSIFTGILNWNKSRFSEEKLWQMMETPSIKKGLTQDFCKYVTGLDPKEPDQRYVKLVFICGNREALNTISWITIKNQTVRGLIQQVASINGIIYHENMFCNIDGAKVNFDTKLNVGNRITCIIKS